MQLLQLLRLLTLFPYSPSDLQTERALVYTIHFSIGFKQIEEIFNDACDAFDESMWLYGNVYDDKDGKTPLGWWTDQQEI